MHETFKSGLHMYVCMYIRTYIHTYIHKRKEIPPHRTPRDVRSWVPEPEKKPQHSTLRKRLHPSHHFLRLIILYLSSAQQSKAANNPKTCLVISLRDGSSPFHMKTSQKKKKKHQPILLPPVRSQQTGGQKKNLGSYMRAIPLN